MVSKVSMSIGSGERTVRARSESYHKIIIDWGEFWFVVEEIEEYFIGVILENQKYYVRYVAVCELVLPMTPVLCTGAYGPKGPWHFQPKPGAYIPWIHLPESRFFRYVCTYTCP